MQILWQDLRYGARMLFRKPGFTLIAVLTLGLGIGANITIFSLVNAVLLKPLPGVAAAERLVVIGRSERGRGFDSSSYPNYLDYRDRSRLFEDILAYHSTPYSLSSGGQTERLQGALVTGNYFAVLGVEDVGSGLGQLSRAMARAAACASSALNAMPTRSPRLNDWLRGRVNRHWWNSGKAMRCSFLCGRRNGVRLILRIRASYSIDKPVKHVQITKAQAYQTFLGLGASPGYAKAYVEMYQALAKPGAIAETRTRQTTTPTTLRDWSDTVFRPLLAAG